MIFDWIDAYIIMLLTAYISYIIPLIIGLYVYKKEAKERIKEKK